MRVLTLVREDEALLRKAEERFSVLKLRWHSGQTATLIELRSSAA
jgi:hypothetical protein